MKIDHIKTCKLCCSWHLWWSLCCRGI